MSDDQKLLERLSGRRELDRDRPETVLIAKPDLRRLLALARKGLEAEDYQEWLKDQLREAAYTIEFLHGCLTSKRFRYEYPEQTQESLAAINAVAPPLPLCHHSRFHDDCEGCAAGKMIHERAMRWESALAPKEPSEHGRTDRHSLP